MFNLVSYSLPFALGLLLYNTFPENHSTFVCTYNVTLFNLILVFANLSLNLLNIHSSLSPMRTKSLLETIVPPYGVNLEFQKTHTEVVLVDPTNSNVHPNFGLVNLGLVKFSV